MTDAVRGLLVGQLSLDVTYVVVNSPIVRWHTQDVYTPVSKAALVATATPRLEELAEPKYDFKFGVVDEENT